MTPELDVDFFGAVLMCPSCGGRELHHDRVDVFERPEDAACGVHVSVANNQAAFDTAIADNPSPRRHGLVIEFWCEGCEDRSALLIWQHKGSTMIDFQILPPLISGC